MSDQMQRQLEQIIADATKLAGWHRDKGRGPNGDFDHTPIAMIRLLVKGNLPAQAFDGSSSSGPGDPTPTQAIMKPILPYHAEAEYKEWLRLSSAFLERAVMRAAQTRPIERDTDTLRDEECCRQHLDWLGRKRPRGKKCGDLCYFCHEHRDIITYEVLAYYETYGKMPGRRVNPKERKPA